MLAGSMQLRSNAGVVGLKRAIGQRGPKAAHGFIKTRRARGLDGVILVVDELQIWTETGNAPEVAAIMGAERAGDGRGINEAREGRLDASEK